MPSETCLTTFIRAALLVGILYACKLPGTVAARRYTLSNLSAYSNIMEEDTRELNPSFGLNYHSSKCVFKGFFRQPGAYACWSEWGPWSICTKPCSGGMRTRHRKCETSQTEGIWCIDKGFEMQKCNIRVCESFTHQWKLTTNYAATPWKLHKVRWMESRV